jgi:hypothetical protein
MVYGREFRRHRTEVSSLGVLNGFTAWLKAYKELITVIVFFAGGSAWIFGYFATKKQVDELNCLFHKNITVLESQSRLRFVEASILETSKRFDELERKDAANKLTPQEVQEKVRLRTLTKAQEREEASARQKLEEAQSDIRENKCRRD